MSTDTNKTMKMLSIVNLSESIGKLKLTESESIAIMALCDECTKKLNEGKHEEELCESFVVELSKIATSENSKNILESLNEAIKKNQSNISLAKDVYSLANGATMYVAPVIESAVVNYMLNKNKETRDDVKVSVSLFENNSAVKSILETLNFESYEEKTGKELVNATLKEEYKETPKKTYTEEEVNAIIENRVAVEKQKMNEVPKKKTVNEMENRIDLHGVIKNILKENSNNDKLRVFCEKYIKALNEGRADEVLYESFISGISNWNYLSAVDTELSALNDRIHKYKQEINLKKVLEMMKETGSYYIVPLIEDVVVDYAENKNMRTRALMLQRLESFEYDPFVRDIISIASRDLSVENTVWLGESVEMVNNYVKSEKIYSPILYLNENETVFNVRGTYYKRLGDAVSKLNKKETAELSESFRNLCALVNSSNVSLSEELNTITVYGGNEKAVISESSITVNGSKVKIADIDRLASTARMMNETESMAFYAAVKVLNENFDSIACVDFVKRVSAKDNSGLCVDVFKINENICVNTINAALGKSVFYKNVNPIQCRKYINEHMGINVAPLFEDVLPDQENTKKNIEAKKQEYESYIKSLEDKKETLEKMKDEGSDTDDIDDAIDMINKEIEDTKNDYKKYQKDAEDFLNGKEDDKEEDDDLKDQKDSEDDDEKDTKGDDEKKDGNDTDENPDDKENGKDQTEGEPKESPEDMEQPITSEPEEEPAAEPDEYADVPDFDPDFDIAMTTVDVPAPEADQNPTPSVTEDTEGYKVVRVSYNKNVKTGKTSNRGEVIVIIPSVDANGDVHDDMRKITFTLDGERKPIVNNEYMPLAMYNAIVNAIDTCPETENVDVTANGEPDNDGSGDGGAIPVPAEEPATTADEVVDTTVVTTPDASATDIAAATVDANGETAPVDAAEQETPAEVQADDQKMTYPISLGIYPEEIAPKDMSDFTKDLDDMKIKHTESEAGDGEVCIEVANRAQCEALKKYIKDWFNYTDENLKSFVPELCECGIKECGVKESIDIKSVRSVNESKADRFSVVVPANDTFCNMFGVKNDGKFDSFSVIADNEKEAQSFYNKLYEHSLKNEVNQDITDILEKYAPMYKENAEKTVKYNLTVPYNGFLESKLEARGFDVKTMNEEMSVEVLSGDYMKTKKLLESVYGEEAPESAKKFIDFVNENIIITIKDESTGKTVEIDADTATSNDASDTASEGADFESSFKDTTTFDPEKSMLFKDDEESAEKEKKEESEDEEKKSVGDENDNEKGENEEEEKKKGDEKKEGEDEEKKDEDKPKKKFKFKATKKESSNESVKESKENSLNEEAAATTVLDVVEIPDGRKGQVISQLADGTLIVNVQGHTLPFERKQLKAVTPRPDNLDFPVKFDPLTLKGVVENYVSCGMFLNNVQVTPNDCKVKLLEYIVAKPEDEINIIIEGEATKAAKKFIRITENLNDVLDLANYAEGKMTLNIEGRLTESDVLIHIKDYMHYKNVNEETCPVRTLVYDENGETHLRYINGTQLRLNESSDIYVPEYVNDLNKAMLLYK